MKEITEGAHVLSKYIDVKNAPRLEAIDSVIINAETTIDAKTKQFDDNFFMSVTTPYVDPAPAAPVEQTNQ